MELNVSEQHDNCRRETEMQRQCDGHDGPITLSCSVVATHEGLSAVFWGSLRAKSPEAHSQVSGQFDILVRAGSYSQQLHVFMSQLDRTFVCITTIVCLQVQSPLWWLCWQDMDFLKEMNFFISHSSLSFSSVFVSHWHPLFCFDWTIYKPKYCCLNYLYFSNNGP